MTYAWARGADRVYVAREGGTGAVEPLGARIGAGDVPLLVKLADGTTRELVTRR